MVETVGIGAFRATPARVTAKDTPIPYATALERDVLPTVDDLVAAVNAMTAA
jgi:pyruvate dehydrogenase E1 component beta subunit